jgi:hypothetical protein
MASALQLIRSVGAAPLAQIQNKSVDLFLNQVAGVSPDPVADALAADSAFTKIAVPIATALVGAASFGAIPALTAIARAQDPVNQRASSTQLAQTRTTLQEARMGLFDDFTNTGVDAGFTDQTSIDWGALLNTGVGLAGRFLAPSAAMATPVATMAAVPAVVSGAGRAVAVVGRGLFKRFPNLATAIQMFRNQGLTMISRARIVSTIRTYGPTAAVAFLTSYLGEELATRTVQEAALAGAGRRRMNPGNTKALRRALRRLKSFDHLCASVVHTRKRYRFQKKC